MPISLEQWRASVGHINASRSCILMKKSPRVMNVECVLRQFLFLLVALASEGLWLVNMYIIKLSRRGFESIQNKLVWKNMSAVSSLGPWCKNQKHRKAYDQFLCVTFHIIVISSLLYLCGDVETNPGPVPFELIPSKLPELKELLKEVKDNWRLFGRSVGLSSAELRTIDQSGDGTDHCFSTVLLLWLDGRGIAQRSWVTLVTILGQEMPHKLLADRIMKDYSLTATQSPLKSMAPSRKSYQSTRYGPSCSSSDSHNPKQRKRKQNSFLKLADIHQTMKQQHCEEVTSPEADTINASMLQSEDGEMMELVVSLPKKKIRLSLSETRSQRLKKVKKYPPPTTLDLTSPSSSRSPSLTPGGSLVTQQQKQLILNKSTKRIKEGDFVKLLTTINQEQREQIFQNTLNISPVHKQQLLNKAQTKIQQRTEKSDITSSSGDEVDNDCKSPPEKIRGAELIVSFSRSLIKVKNNDMDSDDEGMDDLDAKKLFNEAMEKGYVTSQSVVILLIGIAGSGKSSFKHIALNLPLREEYVSTGLAEAAIRNISISRAIVGDSDHSAIDWEIVTPEKLLKMLADAIKTGISKIPEETEISNPDLTPNEDSSCNSSDTDTIMMDSDGSDSEYIVISSDHIYWPDDWTDDYVEFLENSDSDNSENSDTEFDDILPLIRLISQSKGSERLLEVQWVYIIDTGGQPQFLQLLPAFVKNISSCVCFVRLDKQLDDKPTVTFFDKSGKQCGSSSYPSEHSNLQVIESCVRTIYSKSCLFSEKAPKFTVVGTHRDIYEQNLKPQTETLETKNTELKMKLGNILGSNLVLYKSDSLIFPLNCKSPESKDLAVVSEFRKCVMKHCTEPDSVLELPLAWFVLEQCIRQYAQKKGVAYVTRNECLKVSKKLKMSKNAFKHALEHLLKLNIFRNYDSLPELIFCDTHVVLLKLTELVQYSYKLQGTEIIYGLTFEDLNFKNKGMISIKFLRNFEKYYSELFTPESFLCILLELLAIADMQNGSYFMPSLLKDLSKSEIQKYRSDSKLLPPLLLYLDEGCLPNGLFTSLIASLINDHEWILSLYKKEPACLYQNCVKFLIPVGVPGSVTLVASFEYIEIHLHIDCKFESKLDNICERVFNDIKEGLELSWKILYPGNISLKFAFFCGCGKDDIHRSVISSSHCGVFERCSNDNEYGVEITESDTKMHWMHFIRPQLGSMNTGRNHTPEPHAKTSFNSTLTKLTGVESSPYNEALQGYVSYLHSCVCPFLERELDWGNEVEKDLSKIAEQMINWEQFAPHLRLTEVDINDIKKTHQNDPLLQRNEALRRWKKSYQSTSYERATYRNLLRVLVNAERGQFAKVVCDVLNEKHPKSCDCSNSTSSVDPPPLKKIKAL